jgi:hypothetical protein
MFLTRSLTAVAALVLIGTSVNASPEALSEFGSESYPIEFKKPVAYSLSLMSVGLPLLIGGGAFESGPSVNNFLDAYQSPPEWENDSAFFNFVLHPLWGSETYLRAREANFGVPGSIAFSMGMSITWEYLFESWVTHPSAQDLIFTTGIGWMIGEARYKLKARTDDKWDWALDPIHTTLEHLHIGIKRNPKGESETTVALTWEY